MSIPYGGPRACPACQVLHTTRASCAGVVVLEPAPVRDPAVEVWALALEGAR